MTTTPGDPAAVISPVTGWTRAHWAALADRMLDAVRGCASPGHARITLPGPVGGYGRAVDGLEGFARTFLLAGFRLAGQGGADPAGLAQWYARGIEVGTDPSADQRWVRPDEHAQAKVEAASIALILDLTRPWIWDRLAPTVQQRVVDYLAPVVGDKGYPRCNWLWFRIVVETFLRSVGGPWSAADIEADLANLDGFYRGDGWYADGDERAYDHYCGWAMHLYPVLWAQMRGADPFAAPRRDQDTARLDRFLHDYVRLVGSDGSPLVQGRSLAYRFAAAAPLWAGAIAGVTGVSPGQLRRAASGVLQHFVDRGAPDRRGLLTLGWHHEWRPIAQSYSGPSSPYWAAKGLLGLALPPDHPVWTAVEEPLPVEQADQLWLAGPPGWLVSGTRQDGIVRVINHGTDHAVSGARVSDSPLYTRLGYSTATAPLLSPRAWQAPVDQSVVLLDAQQRATHRAGMRALAATLTGEGDRCVAVGGSLARAHWVAADEDQRDHGSGRGGEVRDAAAVATVSMLRGAWEVRCVRVESLPDAPAGLSRAVRLRLGGWALADAEPPTAPPADAGPVRVRSQRAVSVVGAVTGFDAAGVAAETEASPLGHHAAVPWVAGPVVAGRWYVAAVGLLGIEAEEAAARPPAVTLDPGRPALTITWPDGAQTTARLPSVPVAHVPPGAAAAATRAEIRED